jgi:hypothetical protein
MKCNLRYVFCWLHSTRNTSKMQASPQTIAHVACAFPQSGNTCVFSHARQQVEGEVRA